MKYKVFSTSLFLSTALLITVPLAHAGWKVTSEGQLVFETVEQPGQVLGDSTEEVDQEEAEALFKSLMENADSSAYKTLLSEDPEELEAEFSKLLQNVEISENENGEMEAVVTDVETGVTSRSVLKDGKIITEITDAEGNTTQQTMEIEEALLAEATKSARKKSTPSPTPNPDPPQKIRIGAQDKNVSINLPDGQQVTDSLVEIEPNTNSDSIKILSGDNGELIFAQGRVAAKTSFPIEVDTEFNEILVEVGNTTTKVQVLPPAALSNLLVADVIDGTNGFEVQDEWTRDKLSGLNTIIELVDHKEGLAYKVAGYSDQKILGIFKTKIQKIAYVSVETGEVFEIEKKPQVTLVDFFSF